MSQNLVWQSKVFLWLEVFQASYLISLSTQNKWKTTKTRLEMFTAIAFCLSLSLSQSVYLFFSFFPLSRSVHALDPAMYSVVFVDLSSVLGVMFELHSSQLYFSQLCFALLCWCWLLCFSVLAGQKARPGLILRCPGARLTDNG